MMDLTPCEQELAALIAQGRTNVEIADALGVSATTARWQISEIPRELRLRGRVQLALYARDRRLSSRLESLNHS